MAKMSSIENNNRRRRMTASYEKKRSALKEQFMKKDLGFEERMTLTHKMAELPRNSSKTRIRNRCLVTGRSRGFYRKFHMSRIILREYGNMGLIPGLVKASW